ncbi:DUF1161 domain-containing protein [Pantoea sp. 1.19]|uniref:DUF1161 domain-containing protein n=1 Tax=Pantoea sp. 1.19 TaxID=1925589 RepID=UPI000948D0E3|nr:DUF1161 domain-containing protein [Pantoea sp. 1.19]
MKKHLWIISLTLCSLPLVAQASCESVKADISQRIINNGVPAASFSLDIVPNDQADRADGQVVGHCENDSHKIVYKRDGSESDSSPTTGSGEDAASR